MRLLIRPKIKPDNLFLLLEVGLPDRVRGGASRSTTPSTPTCCRR